MDKLHVNVTFTGGGAMFGFFMRGEQAKLQAVIENS